ALWQAAVDALGRGLEQRAVTLGPLLGPWRARVFAVVAYQAEHDRPGVCFDQFAIEPSRVQAAVAREEADLERTNRAARTQPRPDLAALLEFGPEAEVERAPAEHFVAVPSEHALERRVHVHEATVIGAEHGDDAVGMAERACELHAPPEDAAGTPAS